MRLISSAQWRTRAYEIVINDAVSKPPITKKKKPCTRRESSASAVKRSGKISSESGLG